MKPYLGPGLLLLSFLLALVLYFVPGWDNQTHFLSERMRTIMVDYQFRLWGILLLVVVPLVSFLWALWWAGTKLKIPWYYSLAACLVLAAVVYLWFCGLFKGTMRG